MPVNPQGRSAWLRAEEEWAEGRRTPLRALRPPLGSRYRIREVGGVRALQCVEAPTIWVRLQPGVTVSAQEARNAPAGTVFLDGAAEGAPFADPARRVYNLDHHEGCVRAFTLSACEQAMVLVRKGLELRGREWTVIANDADLDAVLAIWVLTNHLRLCDESDPVRHEILPLIRLEGAIDAHGLDLQDLCALPPALLDETRRRMDRLRDHERALKATGRWHKTDLLEYVCERLTQIDALVYPPSAFDDVVDIEELGRAEMPGGGVAVACRARVGIYEVERQLRRLHGPRLALIVLCQRKQVFTVRQVDPTLPVSLDALYAHLNLLDPAAGPPRSGNRWGGSGEIGGSPRASGTRLSVERILEACARAYAVPSRWERVRGVARSALAVAAILGASAAAPSASFALGLAPGVAFGASLLALSGLALAVLATRGRGIAGLRLPRGSDWVSALPVAVLGGLVGGGWLPAAATGADSLAHAALACGLGVVGAEVLMRGLLYGRLLWAWGPGRAAGRGALVAVAFAALCHAAALALLAGAGVLAAPVAGGWGLGAGGALLVGLAAGTARERSESLLPACLAHGVAAAASWSAPGLFEALRAAGLLL